MPGATTRAPMALSWRNWTPRSCDAPACACRSSSHAGSKNSSNPTVPPEPLSQCASAATSSKSPALERRSASRRARDGSCCRECGHGVPQARVIGETGNDGAACRRNSRLARRRHRIAAPCRSPGVACHRAAPPARPAARRCRSAWSGSRRSRPAAISLLEALHRVGRQRDDRHRAARARAASAWRSIAVHHRHLHVHQDAGRAVPAAMPRAPTWPFSASTTLQPDFLEHQPHQLAVLAAVVDHQHARAAGTPSARCVCAGGVASARPSAPAGSSRLDARRAHPDRATT